MHRIKVRNADDYSKLRQTPVEPEEAHRALRHFIQRCEQGRKIPDDLMEFILAGLRRQLSQLDDPKKHTCGWFKRKKGRPEQDDPYLPAKAWYCFHFDERFKKGPKFVDTAARYNAIGDHLRTELNASLASIYKKWPDTEKNIARRDGFSEKSIQRMIEKFTRGGFQRASKKPGDSMAVEEHNILEARLFCRVELGMEDEKADEKAREIVKRWNSKGQK